MHKNMFLTLAAAATIMATPVKAEPPDSATSDFFDTLMATYGLTNHIEVRQSTILYVSMDQESTITHIDDLKSLQLLNDTKSDDYFQRRPTMMANALLIEYAASVVRNVYETKSSVDIMQVIGTLKNADDYGHEQSITLFRFGFTRTLSGKLNWDKFQPLNLPKVSLNFIFTPEGIAATRQEAIQNPIDE